MIRAELAKISSNNANTSWANPEELWDLALQGFSFVSNALRVGNKLEYALALEALIRFLRSSRDRSYRHVTILRNKIDNLSNQLEDVVDPSDPEYARISAQLDLLMQLLSEK